MMTRPHKRITTFTDGNGDVVLWQKLVSGSSAWTRPGIGTELDHQLVADDFVVEYGKEKFEELTYAEATQIFGACVFRSLACASKLNNEEKEK